MEQLRAQNMALATQTDMLRAKVRELEQKAMEYKCTSTGYEKRLLQLTLILRENGLTHILRK